MALKKNADGRQMKMKRKLVSLVATAAIFTTAATTAQAQEVTVHKGDTLWGFSQEYGVSVDSIMKWNNLSSDLIFPNDVLAVAPMKKIVVQKGDTLWGIACDNGVTVDQLMKWNSLKSDLIHPGLNLTIYLDQTTTNNTPAQTKAPAQPASAETKATADVKVEAKAVKVDKVPEVQEKQTETVAAPKPEEKASEQEAAPAVEQTKTEQAGSQETNIQASTKPTETEEKEAGKTITVEATAYTASCEGCSGVTSTGINLKENPDMKVISVDPSVIPLGSKVHVEGYGNAIAGDTGGAIKGNKIDIFIPNHDDAINYGRQQVEVTILD